MFNFTKKSHSWNILELIKGSNNSYDNNKLIDAYVDACPVFTATKWIVDACNDIEFVVKDKNKDELIYNHPILKLLNKPNSFLGGDELKKQIFSNYILTGNLYLMKLRGLKGDILELYSIKPQDVSIDENYQDKFAEYYRLKDFAGAVFKRQQDYKYVASNGNEIVHLKEFNPHSNLFGLSFFAGCSLEIKQYVESSLHNLALIKNGGRPSGLLTFKGNKNLDRASAEAVKSKIDEKLKGGDNAGNILFLTDDFDYKTLGESIKDMDYRSLHEKAERNIFKAIKIPTALIDNNAMTYSNLDVSRFAFYDNAVLPLFKTICKFLTNKVLIDFKGSENLEITFDKSTISALENREVLNTTEAFKNSLITRNEARAKLGYESIEGGDNIYQPMALVPVGLDSNTQDNRESPAKKELRRLMLKNGYSKEDAEIMVKNYES
jgi:HK97 family phage portal protein